VIQRDSSEKDFIFRFGEGKAFPLARVGKNWVFSYAGRIFHLWLCVFPITAELFTSKSWPPFAEAWTLDCDPCGSISLGAACSIAGHFTHDSGCVLFFVMRGRQGGGNCCGSTSPCWLNRTLQGEITQSLGAAISFKSTAEH
jgi:hypothetical protein